MIDPLIFYFTTNIIILVGLMMFIVYLQHQHSLERRELIHALKAKNLQELTTSEIIDKQPDKEVIPPEFMPVESVSDDDYFNLIKKAHGNTE